jgi:hypothetical protein
MDSDSDGYHNHHPKNDGDLASYQIKNTHGLHAHGGVGENEENGGVLQVINIIFQTILHYLSTTLDTFPIVSFAFTWFFIIMAVFSIITRWFTHIFVLNIFRVFSWPSLFSFLFPVSLPFNLITAVCMSFHGARIEETRGSSYLLCFIIIITLLTNSTMFTLRLLFNAGIFPPYDPTTGYDPPLTWIQSHIHWFDSYGWDFLPFSIVMLHGFITNHPYMALFGFPIRLHMTPTLCFVGLLFGITHGFRLSLPIFIAIGFTWLFKYIWLSTHYTRLTGLLLTPLLCQFGQLERNNPWSYDKHLSEQHQIQQTQEMDHKTHNLIQYVISLRTSEQFGELQTTEDIIQREDIHFQLSQLTFLTPPRSYSSTTRDGSNSPPPSIDFNVLQQHGQADEMAVEHNVVHDGEFPERSVSNSSDETTGLNDGYIDSSSSTNMHNGNHSGSAGGRNIRDFNEHSALLVESPDQNCFDCGGNESGKECLRHLKFKSFVYKHTKAEMYPKHSKYVVVGAKYD